MSDTQIKFNATTVQAVASFAKEFTGGYFALSGTGRDLGNGVRYIDGHQMRTWFGPKGARQACAYYIGGILGAARVTGKSVPETETAFLQKVQAAYMEGSQSHKADMRNWEATGGERARLGMRDGR